MKKLGGILMAGTMIISMAVPAFAQQYTPVNGGTVALAGGPASVELSKIVDVDGGNGRWDYGTTLTVTLKKKVWSNLDHNTKKHRSSCEIDGNYNGSGWVDPRTTSKSTVTGARNSVAYTNWDVE